ncbi:hypothetical protein B0H14DRAFT_3717621 [Mycena olivaceomarginata]|nr:hypothetical protein B0H14DRAFT_3717621 [Mycena olivaceomarginata]
MSLPALDTITGSLLIATWANSLLYMSEVYQGLYYFRHFKKDDWKLKTLVTVALLVDTVSTVSNYICVYLYTITHAGDLEYLSSTHWPIPLNNLNVGVLAALVQGFLVIRYWRVTQNPLISLVLSLGIIIAFGGVLASSCMVALYPSFKDRLKIKITVALALVTEATVDAGITLALLWEFRKASGILTETKGILDRLTAGNNSEWRCGHNAGRGGPNFLANLNIRKSFSTTVMSSGPGTASDGEQRPSTLTSWNIDDSCGIHVHRTVHTSVQVSLEDPRQPHSPGTFKHPLQSTAIDGSPQDIEMTSNYVSKKQQTLVTA